MHEICELLETLIMFHRLSKLASVLEVSWPSPDVLECSKGWISRTSHIASQAYIKML